MACEGPRLHDTAKDRGAVNPNITMLTTKRLDTPTHLHTIYSNIAVTLFVGVQYVKCMFVCILSSRTWRDV